MKDNFSIFIPMRAGSKRVINKNSRAFLENGFSLFQHKMNQVILILDLIDEVVISTDDEMIINQAGSYLVYEKIKIIERPKHLCIDSTRVVDLIDYVPKVVSADHIFWLHVTSPFIDDDDYRQAIMNYKIHVINGKCDSLMSVSKIQAFIWDDEKKDIINCDRSINKWPNTQDLTPLYEINHGYYISSRKNYTSLSDRIGLNPYLHVTEKHKCVDIDWEDDFLLCQQLAKAKGI